MSKALRYYPAAIVAAGLLPMLARAQDVDTILRTVANTARMIIGLLFIIATVVFLWGVVKFIASADNETERNKSKSLMWWGIVGLAVMAAAWGVTNILIDYFRISATPPTFREPPRFFTP